ncbi:MAG: glycosyltransferase family 4 protein [Actinobacteria bacterium]|nr:glycosyltransferase family 4 protein [Actinomycetota bacterium]MBU1942416.1 glycosyltransferase family 4 protein [Actinomycetota bacterium]MBU2686288.1 glycosyltransferase family 4 protein [Actinomycetota bacterium]
MIADSTQDFHPAFVVPRYGEEVVGGAEDLARRTAEELASRGYPVTAVTTCALDHHTWRDHYPEGMSELNGVEVLRFCALTNIADPSLHHVLARMQAGKSLSRAEQMVWLEGIVTSQGLLDHLAGEGEGYSHLVFLPYLFGTTYFGSLIHPERSYIIPCLHDEPFAHQEVIHEMLAGVRGLIFNSPGERRLASRLLGMENPGPVVGMGFSPHRSDPAAFGDRTPVRGPFVLYAGRREEGKNTPLLVEYFRRFAIEHPRAAGLVLMGAGEVRIPPDSSHVILDAGRVSEPEKWDAYAAASVFCQPSVNESFSIVLLEAWLAGTPALVNRACDVTREHVRTSGGGLTFSDYPEFAEAVLMMCEDPDRARAMGEAGRRYVETEYNWDSVIGRLQSALDVSMGPAGRENA